MAVTRDLPYPSCNFLVDVGTGSTDRIQDAVAEVIFPDALLQTFQYRDGNSKENNPHLTSTISNYTNLVLRRPARGSLDWYQWWDQARNGDAAVVRSVRVELMSEDHKGVVLAWIFQRARPVALKYSRLNGLDGEPLMETLELAVERMQME